MRFFSFLCSLILHILIIFLAIPINDNHPKIDLEKSVTYRVHIVKLRPEEKKIKRKKIVRKKVKIVKTPSRRVVEKKKVIKIPSKIKRIIKKPKKTTKEKSQKNIFKEALQEIMSSVKKEQSEQRLIEKEIKSIAKNATNENDIIQYDTQDQGEELEQYKAIAELKIKENWRYPVKEPNLSAEVKVVVAKDGTIVKKTLIKSSGHKTFDNSAIKAIEETKALDPIPINKQKLSFIIRFGRGEK